jgi:hypothetical protein
LGYSGIFTSYVIRELKIWIEENTVHMRKIIRIKYPMFLFLMTLKMKSEKNEK